MYIVSKEFVYAPLILYVTYANVVCAFIPILKRGGCEPCPDYSPVRCPNGDCIAMRQVCDYIPDCISGYDESESLCTAAERQPISATVDILRSFIASNGDDFWVKIFGPRARNQFKEMGGVNEVAVQLSVTATVGAFGKAMKMSPDEVNLMSERLHGIRENDEFTIQSIGVSGSKLKSLEGYVASLERSHFFLENQK